MVPDFFMEFIVKAGPFTNIILGAILYFIYRAIATNTTAINKQSDAMVTMSTAMDKLGTALLEVAKNQERAGNTLSEMIRMMERSNAAEAANHNANVERLGLILAQVSGHNRTRA